MYHRGFLENDRQVVQPLPPGTPFRPSIPRLSTPQQPRPMTLQPHEWQLGDAFLNRERTAPRTYSPSAPHPQLYLPNNYGLPVNLSHGTVATESRGVHISNLSYRAQWQDLRDYMRSAGKVVRCDVPHGTNGKPKGHATVLFETPEEAQRACDLFNGAPFMGRPMRVKVDKVAVRKGPPAAAVARRGSETNVRN